MNDPPRHEERLHADSLFVVTLKTSSICICSYILFNTRYTRAVDYIQYIRTAEKKHSRTRKWTTMKNCDWRNGGFYDITKREWHLFLYTHYLFYVPVRMSCLFCVYTEIFHDDVNFSRLLRSFECALLWWYIWDNAVFVVYFECIKNG